MFSIEDFGLVGQEGHDYQDRKESTTKGREASLPLVGQTDWECEEVQFGHCFVYLLHA